MKKIILFFVLFVSFSSLFAQKELRSGLRKGNSQYEKEKYVESEIEYRKAQEQFVNSEILAYNLGNSLFKQEKFDDALAQYSKALQGAKDNLFISEVLHNIGNVQLSKQDFKSAVDSYKTALRLNPQSDESCYNLAFAQKTLKDQEQ